MSLLFSRECEYALQAVLYLALQRADSMTSIKALTRKLDIPYHFLAKILQKLTKKGLLCSLKGPTGGFALALPAGKITLFQIVEAVDGAEFMNTCVLGFSECSGRNPCSVHEQWGAMRTSIHAMLVNKSVEQMARETKKPEYMTKERRAER
jgi:Rrf2 family transcriptional regulator, iron-sulfur cluster assembly transcription factor